MTTTDQEFVAILQRNKHLRTAKEIVEFQVALNALERRSINNSILPELFLVFYDDAGGIEILQRVVKLVESFDPSIYIEGLAKATPVLLDEIPIWLEILYTRVLQMDETRSKLKQVFVNLPSATQDTIRLILRKIAEQEDEDVAVTEAIREKVRFIIEQ